jgi:hypothetical protein
MFLTLLLVTFVIAVFTSFSVAALFDRPIAVILKRTVGEDLSSAWARYMKFAIYVVGVSGGVRIWDLEQYINPRRQDVPPLVLDADHWTLEVYRTVIETLQGTAWMLLAFFAIALVAFVLVRGFEMRRAKPGGGSESSAA